jgi:putative transcriptional regulator
MRLMKLADLRYSLNRTQTRLSELSGVSVETISNVERGTHPPSIDTMVKVSKALGVGLEDIDEFKQRIAA